MAMHLHPVGKTRTHTHTHKLVPRPPNVPLLRAVWSLLDGIWGVLKGSWGVLVVSRFWVLSLGLWPLDWALLLGTNSEREPGKMESVKNRDNRAPGFSGAP